MGLLINFGTRSLQFKRVNKKTKQRKECLNCDRVILVMGMIAGLSFSREHGRKDHPKSSNPINTVQTSWDCKLAPGEPIFLVANELSPGGRN